MLTQYRKFEVKVINSSRESLKAFLNSSKFCPSVLRIVMVGVRESNASFQRYFRFNSPRS